MGRVTPHRWLGELNFKFKYDACEAVISMEELYFEKLWGHGCHKDSKGATSTQWVQGHTSQDGPQQGKTVLGPFYIIKIPNILLSSQINKSSRNATMKMLSSFQNLIRSWSPFQKIMSPNEVLGRQYNTVGSVHVYHCCFTVSLRVNPRLCSTTSSDGSVLGTYILKNLFSDYK